MKMKLIRLWMGPLPKEEIFPEKKRPFLRHWFLHPVKRRLAKYYLAFLQKIFGLKVVAITGSVGKTTTKDMLSAILRAAGPTVASEANITPTYNIPTMILRCSPLTRYLILEMGIEYIGDMDYYTWLARPDIAVITAVNLTHTHYLGDLKMVAHEKGKIGKFAKYLIIPDYAPSIEINTIGKVVRVSIEKHTLPETLIGSHFNLNASLALAVATILRVSPKHFHELSKFTPPRRRMELVKLSSGSSVIDDTYNASPLAVKEALQALFEAATKLKKSPVFVFGQMNELGRYEEESHREIGFLVGNLKSKMKKFEFLCTGPATKHSLETAGFGSYFDNKNDLLQALKPLASGSEHLILVKGSRSWRLDELVDELRTV